MRMGRRKAMHLLAYTHAAYRLLGSAGLPSTGFDAEGGDMLFRPERYEINHRTIKLLIGLIAISLANVTAFFSSTPIASISASYYDEDWARDFLVGSLFAISAFLFAYNGRS